MVTSRRDPNGGPGACHAPHESIKLAYLPPSSANQLTGLFRANVTSKLRRLGLRHRLKALAWLIRDTGLVVWFVLRQLAVSPGELGDAHGRIVGQGSDSQRDGRRPGRLNFVPALFKIK